MDNNMSAMINQLLSNPESMKKLMEMANSMGLTQSSTPAGQQAPQQGGNQEQSSGRPDGGASVPAMAQPSPAINNGTAEALSRAVQALGSLSSAPAGNDRHSALLMALKPYMRTQRQDKLDGAMKLLSAVRMFRTMGGGH